MKTLLAVTTIISTFLSIRSVTSSIECGSQIEVSVEGGKNGCAPMPICTGGFANGNCPSGSTCGIVKTGVYGCKLNSSVPTLQTCAEIAASNPDFSTLYSLVLKYNLTEAIIGNTIFAPTNEAFSDVVKKNLTDSQIVNILAYHVTSGIVKSNQLSNQLRVLMAQGQNSTIEILQQNDPFINNAKIVKADIQCSDGIIHVINQVLTVPANLTVSALASQVPSLTSLVSTLNAVSLNIDSIDETVLAPTNEAFDAIKSIVSTLSSSQISCVLKYHVIPAIYFAEPLYNGLVIKTVSGQNLTVIVNNTGTFFKGDTNTAEVTLSNQAANNGVAHIINAVLIPNSLNCEN